MTVEQNKRTDREQHKQRFRPHETRDPCQRDRERKRNRHDDAYEPRIRPTIEPKAGDEADAHENRRIENGGCVDRVDANYPRCCQEQHKQRWPRGA